jgi:transportin-1
VPEFIKYTGHNIVRVRAYNLEILQSLSAMHVPAMQAHIDAYIQSLFARASDQSPDVRKLVCAALGLILSTRPDKLVPEIKSVVDFIAYSTKDKDESALEATEFWLTFAEDQALSEQLKPFVPIIAPLLLDGMVYTEMDLAELDLEDEEDEAVPDKESDIKPKAYGGKKHGAHETNDPSQANPNGQGKSREAGDKALEGEEEDEDYDDESDYDDDEAGGVWNVRKCSAAALDVMAVSFRHELLDVLLPHLKVKLFDQDWTKRESGILALGAIAEGECTPVGNANSFRMHRWARTTSTGNCPLVDKFIEGREGEFIVALSESS